LQGGNFKLTDQFITKQILPNKLRLRIARKVVNQTIPPSFDFASTGAKSLDLLNIDIKFPSEHTVCGRRFNGEMQYYFFHPVKLSLIVVAWLFEVNINNPTNVHMQRLIDEFQETYDINEEICLQKNAYEGVMSAIRHTLLDGHRGLSLESIWNPFHRDIQKTIHFWGYTGSLTEPPCAGKTMWRIMDVPVQLSTHQLNQMQNILFNNRDSGTCAFTSNHYKGSVARPINEPIPYYKCTRQDYKSDDEREQCGDRGCAVPFSTHLDPWVPPIVDVTTPPSITPTTAQISHGDGRIRRSP
jgi:carbonic anhydrase